MVFLISMEAKHQRDYCLLVIVKCLLDFRWFIWEKKCTVESQSKASSQVGFYPSLKVSFTCLLGGCCFFSLNKLAVFFERQFEPVIPNLFFFFCCGPVLYQTIFTQTGEYNKMKGNARHKNRVIFKYKNACQSNV